MAQGNLRALRDYMEAAAREAGYGSLHALAVAKDARVSTLTDWWSGRHRPDLDSLAVWAAYLGKEPRTLMNVLYGAEWRVVLLDELEPMVQRAAAEALRLAREASHDG